MLKILIFVSVIRSDPISLDDQNKTLDVRNIINSTKNLNEDKQENVTTRTNLANHRMHEDSKTEADNSTADFLSQDSILRPRLALQIFTNSKPADSQQQNLNPQPSSDLEKSAQRFIRPHWQSHLSYDLSRESNPNSQSEVQQGRQNDRAESNESNQIQMPAQTHQSSDGPPIIEAKSNQELNSWRYVMDNPDSSGLIVQSPISYVRESQQEQANDNSATNQGTVIRAIISIPTQEHEIDTKQASQNSTNHTRDDTGDLTSSDSVVSESDKDQDEGSTSSNIEVSMNLNGDEIIIAPIEKQIENRVSTLSNRQPERTNKSVQDRARQPNLGRHSQRAKDSKSRISLELGGQRSASEIVIVDEADNGDSGTDGDEPQEEDESNEIEHSSSNGESNKLDPSDSNGSQNMADRQMRESRSQRAVKLPSESSQDESDSENDEKSPAESVEQDKSSTDDDYNLDYDESPSDKAEVGSSKTSQTNQVRGTEAVPKRKVKSMARLIRKIQVRKLSPTNKPARNPNRPNRMNQNPRQMETEQPAASSIVIKGEDLRKFEQLLESLRSIAFDKLKGSRPKTRQLSPESRSNRVNDRTRLRAAPKMDEGDWRDIGLGKRGSMVMSQMPSNDIAAHDPDQSQQTQDCARVEDHDSPDTSITLRVEEPQHLTSNSINQDIKLNPNIENDSPSDEAGEYNPESQEDEQIINLTTTDKMIDMPSDVSHQLTNAGHNETQPRPFFIRQTTLQNYSKSQPTDVNEGHYKYQRNGFDQMEGQAQEILRARQRTIGQTSAPRSASLDKTNTFGGYIDYNQLDNREVFRAVEGPKQSSRVIISHQLSSDGLANPTIAGRENGRRLIFQ